MQNYKLNMDFKAASVLSESNVRKQIHIMINDYMDSHLEIEEVRVEIIEGEGDVLTYTFTIHDTSNEIIGDVTEYVHNIFDFEEYADKRDVTSACAINFINKKEKRFHLIYTLKF